MEPETTNLQGIDHVFIVHYFKLTERIEYIINFFKKNNFKNYTIVYGIDRNSIPDYVVNMFYSQSLASEKMHKYFQVPNYIQQRCLTGSEIGNIIAHYTGWEKTVSQNFSRVLVLEDDAIFPENFFSLWNEEVYPKMPPSVDIAYLHSHLGTPRSRVKEAFGFDILPGKYWVKIPKYVNRNCVSYLVTKELCQQLLENCLPFSLAIDNEMTLLHIKFKHKVYWIEPPIIDEGSGTDIYPCSVEQRSTTFF